MLFGSLLKICGNWKKIKNWIFSSCSTFFFPGHRDSSSFNLLLLLLGNIASHTCGDIKWSFFLISAASVLQFGITDLGETGSLPGWHKVLLGSMYYVHVYAVSYWIVAAIMKVKCLLAIPVMTLRDLEIAWWVKTICGTVLPIAVETVVAVIVF